MNRKESDNYNNYQEDEILVRDSQAVIQDRLFQLADLIASAPAGLPNKRLLLDLVNSVAHTIAQPAHSADTITATHYFIESLSVLLEASGYRVVSSHAKNAYNGPSQIH